MSAYWIGEKRFGDSTTDRSLWENKGVDLIGVSKFEDSSVDRSLLEEISNDWN
jgi:hypothetical protein